MDKRLVLAVAGSGKTSEIIDKVNYDDKTLIVTYTEANYNNIKNKIIKKFNEIPSGVRIYTYFSFLYKFCFAPLKKDLYVKGLEYNPAKTHFVSSQRLNYYMNMYNRKMYHSRLAKLCNEKLINDIRNRLEKYFNNIYIDEIQDFSGHDFNLLLNIIKCNCNIFLVGDFYQHTYDTSRDGNVNKNLYNNYYEYVKKFKAALPGLVVDNTSFLKSKRCSKEVCFFIKKNIGIDIESYFNQTSKVQEIISNTEIANIIEDDNIVKLFFQNSKKYDIKNVDNWGNSKGETYNDVCVVLNEKTYNLYISNKLTNLAPTTKNKLYVACSRPTNNLYIIQEKKLKSYLKNTVS